MNQEQLNAIKERAAKATPGPWVIEESRFGSFNAASVNENYDLPACLMKANDADFVTKAREDVPALVDEVEYLRGMLRDTRRIVRQKVKGIKTLQNACKKHKAKQEALEFHLKVSIRHAEELDESLEAEVDENEQLREVVKEFIDYWATTNDARPLLEIVKDACQALGGEAK
ncbi:hypothetical protein C3943_18065 [Lysinibacillus sp. B2A1]|nr:hypothetical protein C3943_18065 [Lysinibacillus sp. B2A1]